jgi:acyl-coenzyme A thioesterase PaaI-like protein
MTVSPRATSQTSGSCVVARWLGALDSTMGMAAGSLAPDDQCVLTAHLSLGFIWSAWEGKTLVATGVIYHKGEEGKLRTERHISRFGRDDREATREARGVMNPSSGPSS